MGVAISSREELEAWLEGKPRDWALAIALRCALRVVPIALDPKSYRSGGADQEMTKAVFRAVITSSAVAKISPDQPYGAARYAAFRAARALVARVSAAQPPSTFLHSGNFTNSAAVEAAAIAANAAAATYLAESPNGARGFAAHAAGAAARAPAFEVAAVWQSVVDDCGILARDNTIHYLIAAPLWRQGPPHWFPSTWARASAWLDASPDGFAFWRPWYDRKLRGARFEFADFDEVAENEFLTRLFAQDDEWWSREPAIVNAEIAGWVAELGRPKPSPTDEDLRQNSRAITFGPSPDSRVGLRSDQDLSQLDFGPEALARHREALEEAQRALEFSRHGVTQADDLERPLLAYLEAMGTSLNGLNPGLLIARGEKLRRLISLRSDPESFAAPFGEEQQGALQDWMIAHNLLVGLDPYLSGIEKIARGPDALPIVIELEALKAIIQSATNSGIPTAEAAEALNDVADNVPRAAPPEDRRNIQATEALKNFVRGVAETIKKHPIKTAGGIGGTAYAAANWVQRNMEWLRDAFANENSILSILEWIASLPL